MRSLLRLPSALLAGLLALSAAEAAPPAPAGGPAAIDACYSDISTAAETLQICLVNQSYENECLPDEQALAAQMKLCGDAGGRQDRMDLARQIGAATVQGDPMQSPYQQMVLRKKEAKRLLRVNEDRFRSRFVKLLNYSPQIFEQAFDTRNCPLAFEGTGQNYLMSGFAIVKRQGEQVLPQTNIPEEEQTHLFFARMVRGKCYRADATALTPETHVEPDQTYYIYNFTQAVIQQLPDEGKAIVIDEIRKPAEGQPFQVGKPLSVKVRHYPTFIQGKVIRHLCDSPLECLKQRARLIDDYENYNRGLRQKNQGNACLIYLDPNRAGEISIDQLYGMDCNDANGHKFVEEGSRKMLDTGSRLFR